MATQMPSHAALASFSRSEEARLPLLGTRLSVRWEKAWYSGTIMDEKLELGNTRGRATPVKKTLVRYTDGEEQWHDLEELEYEILGEASAADDDMNGGGRNRRIGRPGQEGSKGGGGGGVRSPRAVEEPADAVEAAQAAAATPTDAKTLASPLRAPAMACSPEYRTPLVNHALNPGGTRRSPARSPGGALGRGPPVETMPSAWLARASGGGSASARASTEVTLGMHCQVSLSSLLEPASFADPPPAPPPLCSCGETSAWHGAAWRCARRPVSGLPSPNVAANDAANDARGATSGGKSQAPDGQCGGRGMGRGMERGMGRGTGRGGRGSGGLAYRSVGGCETCILPYPSQDELHAKPSSFLARDDNMSMDASSSGGGGDGKRPRSVASKKTATNAVPLISSSSLLIPTSSRRRIDRRSAAAAANARLACGIFSASVQGDGDAGGMAGATASAVEEGEGGGMASPTAALSYRRVKASDEAISHACQTARLLTLTAYEGGKDAARALGGWHADYADELPTERMARGSNPMAMARLNAKRCTTPGCTLPEYHPGLCTSQQVSGVRVRKPSALLRRADSNTAWRGAAVAATDARRGGGAMGGAAARAGGGVARGGGGGGGKAIKPVPRQQRKKRVQWQGVAPLGDDDDAPLGDDDDEPPRGKKRRMVTMTKGEEEGEEEVVVEEEEVEEEVVEAEVEAEVEADNHAEEALLGIDSSFASEIAPQPAARRSGPNLSHETWEGLRRLHVISTMGGGENLSGAGGEEKKRANAGLRFTLPVGYSNRTSEGQPMISYTIGQQMLMQQLMPEGSEIWPPTRADRCSSIEKGRLPARNDTRASHVKAAVTAQEEEEGGASLGSGGHGACSLPGSFPPWRDPSAPRFAFTIRAFGASDHILPTARADATGGGVGGGGGGGHQTVVVEGGALLLDPFAPNMPLAGEQLRHALQLAAKHLCARLLLPNALTRQVWEVVKLVLDEARHLLEGRHLDQLLMCAIYGVCKTNQKQVNFSDIVDQYKRQHGATARTFREVKMRSSAEPPQDIIQFYNAIFIPAMKDHLLRVAEAAGGAQSEARELA